MAIEDLATKFAGPSQAYDESDDDFRARLVARATARRGPSLFETVLEAAADASLLSLRCEPLGVAAYRLWKTGPGDSEHLARQLSERLPATVFVQVAVEDTQHIQRSADQ